MRNAIALATTFAIAPSLAGQRILPPLPTYRPADSVLAFAPSGRVAPIQPPPSVAGPIVGGLLGGALGLFGGYALGMEVGGGDKICGDDPCGFATAIYGAFIGEIVGVPVGVHLANGRRGNFGEVFGAGLSASLVALTLAWAADRAELLALGVMGQLAASVVMERRTGRSTPP